MFSPCLIQHHWICRRHTVHPAPPIFCQNHWQGFWHQPSSLVACVQSLLVHVLHKSCEHWWGYHEKSSCSHMDQNGHYLAPTLLSVVIPSLSGKHQLLEKDAWRLNVQKSPYASMLVLVVRMIRNAVWFSTLEWWWVFGFSSLPYHGEETAYSNDPKSYTSSNTPTGSEVATPNLDLAYTALIMNPGDI